MTTLSSLDSSFVKIGLYLCSKGCKVAAKAMDGYRWQLHHIYNEIINGRALPDRFLEARITDLYVYNPNNGEKTHYIFEQFLKKV